MRGRSTPWAQCRLVGLLALTFALSALPCEPSPQGSIPTNTDLYQPPADTPREWLTDGRPLPKPESVQPTLDRALPVYRAHRDLGNGGNLAGGCSALLPGLLNLWIDGFRRHHPGVAIELYTPYSARWATGQWMNRVLDFVVSAELDPRHATAFRGLYRHSPLAIPVSAGSYRHPHYLGAVAFFVNKQNPLTKVTLPQLDALYNKTRYRGQPAPITKWGDLGLTGEWASKPIHAWGVRRWSSLEEFLRLRIGDREPTGDPWDEQNRGQWRDDLLVFETVRRIPDQVAQDRYALGYAGLDDVDGRVKVVSVARQAGEPFYEPSYENVARDVYPLTRVFYINVSKTPGRALNPVLDEFIRFILSSDGQALVLKQQVFLPLTAAQATRSRALLEN